MEGGRAGLESKRNPRRDQKTATEIWYLGAFPTPPNRQKRREEDKEIVVALMRGRRAWSQEEERTIERIMEECSK